jgi:ABC-type maltose transport system permease subunit
LVSAAVTVVGVTLSCSAAYALSRFRFPGRDGSLRLFLFAQMFPGVVTTIPLYVVLEKLHLLNHLGGLVALVVAPAIAGDYVGDGFAVVALRAGGWALAIGVTAAVVWLGAALGTRGIARIEV